MLKSFVSDKELHKPIYIFLNQKKRYIMLMVLCSIFFQLMPINSINIDEQAKKILEDSIKKCFEVKTMKYNLKIQERVYGKTKTSESTTKLMYYPSYKTYMKQLKPKVGLEVLYCEGERGNLALINTNGFPWVNVTFSPFSNTMHKESHHNLTRSGVRFIGKIMDKFTENINPDDVIAKEEDEVVNGRNCHKITFMKKDFQYLVYTVKKNETIFSISDKFLISPYIIIENNLSVIDDYEEALYEGEKLLIPSAYAKKIKIWIDKSTLLPLKLYIEDDKGFYESYEYSNMQINVVFKENEFNENYPDYNF